jgi:hypothetical protein
MHNCTPLADTHMLDSSRDRENSTGTAGNRIHIDTWFCAILKQPLASKLSVF